MHLSTLFSAQALHFLALAKDSPRKPPSKNAILLSDVHSLTFQADAKTTARRSKPIPQLTCEGPACAYHHLTSLRCVNAGAGYGAEDIQWTCTASLPAAFKLGSTDVSCEGYARADDDYVLRGSCGVTYRLLFTEQGDREYAARRAEDRARRRDESSTWASYAFGLLFLAVFGWILYSAFLRARENRGVRRVPRHPGDRRRRPPGGGGGGGDGWWPGGGGGGGGGWGDYPDEPPPPYSPRWGKFDAAGSGTGRRGGGGGGWGSRLGGFWTGALGGAAAGYAAGSAASSRRRRTDQGWGPGSGTQGGWGGSSSGGGGGGNGGGFGSSSAGPSHESTGFGGTSRR